jgi:hypothetical protein
MQDRLHAFRKKQKIYETINASCSQDGCSIERTHVFGEDPGGGAVDGDLPVAARVVGGRRRRRAGRVVGADRGVEAVHVDEAVHGEVLLERGVAGVGDVGHAEVAPGLDVGVHPVGDDGVVPGVVDHARLVRLVVHERVPDHQALEVDVALLGPRPVAVEDLLRQLRDVVPCTVQIKIKFRAIIIVGRLLLAPLTGVALAGDVEVVGPVLREPLEPVEQELVSVVSCIIIRAQHTTVSRDSASQGRVICHVYTYR